MKALIFNPELTIGDVPEPEPGPSQALVQVQAVALNFGELAYRPEGLGPDHVSGWDAAGIVVRAAADGTGPLEGTRVATFGWSGAWAERRVVDVGDLAVVPDHVDLGAAAALPVAGTTALQAVRRLGPIRGRRVLVTGASGGVGRFAVQLAARAGAHVIASVGSPERGAGLAAAGAAEIVLGPERLRDRVYGVLDNVGGSQLAEAFLRLEDDGVVQAIGKASREPTVIDFELARVRSARGRIENFNISVPLGDDLDHLVSLLAAGKLDPQIGWRGPWDRATEAARALLNRRVAGKAVIDLPSSNSSNAGGEDGPVGS
ncbi:zinc-binding dehydrogenase [Glycomyces sp. TRM65418]|uniref:zinc-binding dehydrogenase n=1 Tax=Glycomyces sp. TRM65418 TaxID=2867006 RepID=UPI001CE6B39D|nr:zinc-binding dehydrogenase [Glycomyces sp. TRM65418]MCC3765942.1 zinc-binding dehydrogenase [Glycomyces sp. TRM65418]QZD55524.1 zinc-binding dehydrogenase [Glycomyces sp. TRM65418]